MTVPECQFFLTSSMTKVFHDERPEALKAGTVLSSFREEKAAIQLVYYCPGNKRPGRTLQQFKVSVTGAPGKVTIRKVKEIPVHMPAYEDSDGNYLRKSVGLYPDILEENEGDCFYPYAGEYRALWITFDIPADAAITDYDIDIKVKYPATDMLWWGVINEVADADADICDLRFKLSVGPRLPKLDILHTEWFHTDCLVDYYGLMPWSERFWQVVKNYLTCAVREHSINTILTPIFTPPLDTYVGGERTSVQLVTCTKDGDRYSFDFKNLRRWMDICRDLKVEYIELPPLFTQWGAKATPNIYAYVDGCNKRIFGWDVPSTDAGYIDFLGQLIPEVLGVLKEYGYDRDHVIRHTSDEPPEEFRDSFLRAQKTIDGIMEGCLTVDHNQVHENDLGSVDPKKWPDTVIYYCCGQGTDNVPNRFCAMPSYRSRVTGLHLYLYGFRGFLHWGFNFYNAGHSFYRIDPYQTCDGDCTWPAGDPFLVYPGKDGKPVSSIRMEIMDEVFLDLRMLKELEHKRGREFVMQLIYEDSRQATIDMWHYPDNNEYYEELRNKVTKLLREDI